MAPRGRGTCHWGPRCRSEWAVGGERPWFALGKERIILSVWVGLTNTDPIHVIWHFHAGVSWAFHTCPKVSWISVFQIQVNDNYFSTYSDSKLIVLVLTAPPPPHPANHTQSTGKNYLYVTDSSRVQNESPSTHSARLPGSGPQHNLLRAPLWSLPCFYPTDKSYTFESDGIAPLSKPSLWGQVYLVKGQHPFSIIPWHCFHVPLLSFIASGPFFIAPPCLARFTSLLLSTVPARL